MKKTRDRRSVRRALGLLLALALCLSLLPAAALAEEGTGAEAGSSAGGPSSQGGSDPIGPTDPDPTGPTDPDPTGPTDPDPENVGLTYPVTGGNLTFRLKTGTIIKCDASVTKAVIPSEIQGFPVTSIGDSAFHGCKSLTSVTIPSSVTSIGGGAFDGCTGLKSIEVSAENQNYSSADGILYNKDQSQLILCPKGITGPVTIPGSLRIIGGGVFSWCTGLTDVTIQTGVTGIGEYAFSGCTGLTDVTIPSSVTSIGKDAFYGCTGLTSVTIPGSVTSIGYAAFDKCTGLTDVTFLGDAPDVIAADAFLPSFLKDVVMLHYREGASGWTSPTWNGYAASSDPLIIRTQPNDVTGAAADGKVSFTVKAWGETPLAISGTIRPPAGRSIPAAAKRRSTPSWPGPPTTAGRSGVW